MPNIYAKKYNMNFIEKSLNFYSLKVYNYIIIMYKYIS